jgi:hypothetical protein
VLGDDEQMEVGPGIDVLDRNEAVRSVDDVRRRVAGDDAAEDAVGVRQRESPPR